MKNIKTFLCLMLAIASLGACRKEFPVSQTEDVWEITLSSDSGDIIPTKAGNVQKILSLKNPLGIVTATLKKNGSDYDKSDLTWEWYNTETTVYSKEGSGNSITIRAITKGGTANNLEVRAKVGGVYRGGIDANHGKYVDVKVIGDYQIESPGDLYEKGYTDCNGSTNTTYDQGSSGQVKVYEWISDNQKNDVTSSCSNWKTNIAGTSITAGGLLSATQANGGGVSGTVSCSCNGESLTSDQITVKRRTYSLSLNKDSFAQAGETATLTYNLDGFYGLFESSSNPSWIKLIGGPISGGNDKISVSISENDTWVTRTGDFIISPYSNGTNPIFKKSVTQVAQGGTISISPEELIFYKTASSESVSVTVSSGQPWTVSSNQSWCTLSTNGSSGPGSVTVSVSANNSGSTRTATLTFTSAGSNTTLSVTQYGTAKPESFEITSTCVSSISLASATQYTIKYTFKNNGTSDVTIKSGKIVHDTYNGGQISENTVDYNSFLANTVVAAGDSYEFTRGFACYSSAEATFTYLENGVTKTKTLNPIP